MLVHILGHGLRTSELSWSEDFYIAMEGLAEIGFTLSQAELLSALFELFKEFRFVRSLLVSIKLPLLSSFGSLAPFF